jgi:phosphoserine phosphatase RsbU/P
MRVLIAGDEACVRHQLQSYLSSWGHECIVAPDSRTALRLTEQCEFDLALIDTRVPVVPSTLLVSRIREACRDRFVYVLLCAPRAEQAEVVRGFDAGADDYLFKPFDREVLRMRLRTAERLVHLHRAMAQNNERLARELARARAALNSMLPGVPESGPVDLAWLFEPCAYLGGDLFNAHALDDHRVSVYGFDVAGHGVASALLAVMLGNMLRPWSPHGQLGASLGTFGHDSLGSPAEVADLLNQRFPFTGPVDLYFTLFYGVIDRSRGVLDWVRAGHPPALLVRDEGLVMLELGDPPIGFLEGHRYTSHSTRLGLGDRLVLYSDGITEARDPEGAPFGLDRLCAAVGDLRHAPLPSLVGEVERSLLDHRGSRQFDDDLSMLVVEAK